MSELTLIYFEGCPNAQAARDVLQESGVPYGEVRQDDLPAGHPQRGYTSPTVLAGEVLLYGAVSGEPGCSIAPLDAEALRAAVQRAGGVNPSP